MTQKRYPRRFPLKIILSYLVLAALAGVVSIILYTELRNYLGATSEFDEKKAVETGSLINLVYETDSFSRLALLSDNEEDFEQYQQILDSLYQAIANFKKITPQEEQVDQLDSIKSLLILKNKNIVQLRELILKSNDDTSFDDILREFQNLEDNMGKLTPENTLNRNRRSREERETYNNIIKMLNQFKGTDTMKVPAKMIDSTLAATRYIVAEAKYLKNKNREELQEKESELIANDLIISKNLRELISAFEAEITENYVSEKTSQQRSVNKASSVLKIAGVVGILVVLLFSYIIISDFFKAEKLRKKLRLAKEETDAVLKSREQLIATVSHDLKTPLHTISGYTELFKNTKLSEKQSYYADQIASGSHFITELVNDLLDFSKLEAGKLKIDHTQFHLENLLIESSTSVKDRYLDKEVALEFSIAEELKDRYFKSDPLRIKQIVLNLVSNAFKFTETGSIRVIADIHSETEMTLHTKITVTDTGIGISQEKLDLIFNEFTQAEDDTSKKFGGTGLGLAISKKLAGLLGGSIAVESNMNEGSSFFVTIPLEKVTRDTSTFPSKKSIEEKSLESLQLKALVFDDDSSMRALLSEVLEQEGIRCHAFEAFSEFETVAGVVEYDFVLTDIQMPETNGFEILEALQKKESLSYTGQPVIAMTGDHSYKSDIYYEKGFSKLVHKPFHKHELLQILHSMFDTGVKTNGVPVTKSTSEASIYDLTLLKSFMKDKKALHEILSVFLMQTHKDMLEFAEAMQHDDVATIRALSHRKLTMSRQIQANNVVVILERLEKIKEGDKELFTLYAELKKQIDILVAALENELS